MCVSAQLSLGSFRKWGNSGERISIPQKTARDQPGIRVSVSKRERTQEWRVRLCTGGRGGNPVGLWRLSSPARSRVWQAGSFRRAPTRGRPAAAGPAYGARPTFIRGARRKTRCCTCYSPPCSSRALHRERGQRRARCARRQSPCAGPVAGHPDGQPRPPAAPPALAQRVAVL